MAVRLKDIAQELGVSTVTVSKVLRGNTDISTATRERVLKRMQELNYRPNMLARGLAGGLTGTMGLIVPDLVHPFFAEVAKALSIVLRAHDRASILASSEEDPELEKQEIRTLLHRGVDVLLIASCRENLQTLREPGEAAVPCVLFDRDFAQINVHFVGLDDVEAGVLATEHLLARGSRRIAHIAGGGSSPAVGRASGYRKAMENHQLPVPNEYLVGHQRVEEAGDRTGFAAMQTLLRLEQAPDAVFCYNDLTAVGAMEAVLGAGLRIPEDVAILGCGNFRYADYLRVPLSSVEQSVPEMGRIAGEMAIELSLHPELAPRKQTLKPTIVERASTRRV